MYTNTPNLTRRAPSPPPPRRTGNHPTLRHIATQGCARLCTNATKSADAITKIGTPFKTLNYLDFCERVRPMALIWDRFRIKVIRSAPVLSIALQKHAGHFTTFGHMAPRACEKCECLSRIGNRSVHVPVLLLRKTQSYPRTPIQS